LTYTLTSGIFIVSNFVDNNVRTPLVNLEAAGAPGSPPFSRP
jgi:hypothetical protein